MQTIELVKNADAASDESGQRSAGDTQTGERPNSEDQARIENQVDDVRNPKQAHGDGRIPSATEDRIVEEEQEHGTTAAQTDPGVVAAFGDDLRRSAHQAKQVGCKRNARNSDGNRHDQAQYDGLNRGHGRAFRVFLSDASPRD